MKKTSRLSRMPLNGTTRAVGDEEQIYQRNRKVEIPDALFLKIDRRCVRKWIVVKFPSGRVTGRARYGKKTNSAEADR